VRSSLDELIRSQLDALEAEPGSLATLESLEGLYREAGRPADLLALLERQARLVGSRAAAASILRRAAGVARRDLSDPARAEELLLRALALQPRAAESLRALAEVREERGDLAGLAEALEQEADRTSEPLEAAARYLALGRFCEERLGRRDRAVLYFGRALRLDPSLVEARRRAVACSSELGRHAQAKRLLDAWRDAGGDRVELASAYAQMGAALSEEPLEHGLAIEALVDALVLDRAAPAAAETLARLKAASRTWREKAQALAVEAAEARDRGVSARLWLRLAALHAAFDPDPAPRVREAFDRAWAASPGQPALDLLDRWHAERQDWEGLRHELRRLGGETRDLAAAVAVHLRLAQVELVRFGDAARALEALEKALQLDPSCETAALQALEMHVDAGNAEGALSVLERHLAVAPRKAQHAQLRLRAAEMALAEGEKERGLRQLEGALVEEPGFAPAAAALAPLLEEAADWPRLVEVLEVQASAEGRPGERAALLERIAQVQSDRLGQPREAVATLARALLAAPARAGVRQALETAAAHAGAFLELAQAFRAAAAAADDVKTRKSLLRRLAEIHERDLSQPEEAVRVWRAVVELDPADRGAAAALEACLARAGQHAEVAAELSRRLASAEGPERREVASKLARLHLEAGEAERAAAAWGEVLARDGNDLEALRGLAASLRVQGGRRAAEELCRTLSRLAATGAPDRIELELERAALLLDPLERLADAAAALLALLEAGGLPSAQSAAVVRALEGLLARGVEPVRIARALVPHHAAAGDAARHVAMLELLARQGSTPPEERARMWLDASAIRLERLGDLRGALQAAGAALRLVPSHPEARRRVEDLALRARAFPVLYALLSDAADRLVDRPDEERAVRLRAARLAEEELGSNDQAAAQLRRARELDPGDPEILASLTRLAVAGERWEEAVDLLLARARAAPAPERQALLVQLGDLLLERMRGAPAAASVYRQALELASPEQRPRLLARLARALESSGDRGGQAQVLAELASVSRPPEGAGPAPAEALAADPYTVLARARAALERDPGDAAALVDLERVAAEMDRPGDLAWALERRRAAGGRDDPDVAFRLAELKRTRLGDPAGALRLHSGVLRADPAHTGSRAALLELARVPGPIGREALAMADALLQALGDLEGRVAARESRLASVDDPVERARLHGEVRAILEVDLGQPGRALDAARRAFGEGGKAREDALADVPRLAEKAKRFGVLAELCELAAAETGGPRAVELLRRAARVREGWLDDPATAAAAWRRLLAVAPADAEALEALDRILSRERRTDELVPVLEALAEARRAEPGRRLEVLLRRAVLLEGAEDPRAAVEAYARILEDYPHDDAALAGLARVLARPGARPAAARLLERVHRAAGEAGPLADVLEQRLEDADEAERGAILGEIAALRERLGMPAEAFAAKARQYRELAKDAPEEPAVRADLDRLASQSGDVAGLAVALEEGLRSGLPAGAASEVRRRLAGLYVERLSNPDRAARLLEELAAEAPRPEVLGALARLHRRTGAWRSLVDVLRRQAAATEDPRQRRDLFFEIGAVLDERLSDREGAMEAYRQILSVDPEEPTALQRLGSLLGAAERWDEVVQLLDREASAAERRPETATEGAEIRYRTGRVRQQRLGDAAGALQAYEAVLARVPRHPATLVALEELARGTGAPAVEAARILEPIYQQEGEHRRLVEALEARLPSIADPAERAGLLRRVAEVYAGPLKSAEMAFLSACRALREDPDDLASMDLAGRLGQGAGLEEELSALLAEAAERARDPRARAECHRRMARLAARADAGRAAEEWQKLLDLAPDDPEALEGLTSLQRTRGETGSLVQVLRRRLAIEEDADRRAALLGELAEAQEGAGDLSGATGSLRRLLEARPQDRSALGRLAALCERGERWGELAEVLAREVAAADAAGDAAGAVDLRERLAALRETRLLDREGALSLSEEILARRPDHAAALERLEAMLQRDPGNVRAAQALERAHAATGSWERHAAALEARAAARPDPLERKALWVQLAEVREKRLGSAEQAFLALARALREDPSDAALRAELDRLAGATGQHEELAALYEEQLDRLGAGGAPVALQLGFLHEGPLGRPEDAPPFYERARRLDPGLAPRALPALERLYRKLERWPELAEVLSSLAARETRPEERAGLLYRLGQAWEERLGSPERAVAAYEAVLQSAPGHLPSLRALERIHEQAGRNDALLEVLSAERKAAEPAARERITTRMAEVAAALGRDAEAVDLWREVLREKPRSEQALAALEVLLERQERWSDLAEVLRTRIPQAQIQDRREAVRLQEKLGRLLARRLGDPAQAIRSFQAVLEGDPRNRGALEALRDLHAEQGDRESLAQVYRRLVPLQEDAAGVKRVRLDLAEVLLAAGQRQEAVEQAKRAFDIEPHDADGLARLEAVFQAAGAPADATRAAEGRAALLAAEGRSAEAVAAWQSAAASWQSAGRAEEAAAALERALALDPGHREAFDRLRDLHAASGDWRAYARATEAFLPRVEDRAARASLLEELGEIHERRLGQKEMGFLAWCRAFQEDPASETARAAVERLAAETEAFEELAEVYDQVAETARGPQRARLLLRLGQLRDERLDDAEGAEAAFRRALDSDPTSQEALESLSRLFGRRGRPHDLVIALEQKLEAVAGLEEKKATLLEIARIQDAELHDADEAAAALRRILELDGGDVPALEALAFLLRRERRHGDLAHVLARARDLAPDLASRIAWQLQLAALHEQEMADDEAAVEAYRAVLGMDDRQPEALAGLERLYTKLDRFAELNRVYEKQADIAGDVAEQVRILGKSASIWEEKLGNPQKAIERSEQALRLDGGHLPAVKSLERLYRQEGMWDRLIIVTQHHLSLVSDPRERVALLLAVGEVFWKELQRADRAEAAFLEALEVDPESRDAVAALGRLYERSGNWNLALEMLRREARLAAASPDAVDLHFRMGRIHEDMLLDLGAAKLEYERALDLEPGHLPSLRAMKGIREREGSREEYLRLLLAESRYAEDDATKAALLTEAGRIHQEERADREGAARLYEEALRRVPDHLPAARPLSEIRQEQAAWADAERVLDVVVGRLARDGDARELCRQSYRLGYVCEKLQKPGKALAAYRRAYELDATYLPALEGLGNLLVQAEQWDEALRIFQAILIHHRDGLTDLEVVETYWQIGEIQESQGHLDRAAKSFEKALEMDQNHEPSRRGMVRVLEAQGSFEAAVEHRQRLAPLLEGRARFEQYAAIGEIARERLRDPYMAIDAFLAASRVDAADVRVAEALLGLYRETRQAQKAADVMARMLEAPEVKADPARAAQLHLALGELYRDEIEDPNSALAHFELALDRNPRLVKAFAAIEALLGAERRWPELEQAYQRMIQRLPRGPEAATARVALWNALGDLYRRALQNPEGARMAYEVVAKADPDDMAAAQAYAELSTAQPGHEAEAVEAWRRLLQAGHEPGAAASRLVSLFAARKDYDRAYSAAQVKAHLLGGATPEELEVLSKLRRFARDTATRPMDDALWGRVLHERLRGGPLPAILTLVAQQAASLFVQSPKDLGLNPKKDEIDVGASMLFLASTLKYVSRTLGAEGMRLFRSAQSPGRLGFANTEPPGLVAGEEMFRERPKKELWFAVGKVVCFARRELRLGRLMPHDQLDVVFQAACSLGTSRFVVTADPNLVQKLKNQLERILPEHTRTQTLKKLARAYCDVQQPGDVRAYMDAVELTSNRVGALLAGDLEIARRMAVQEKAQVSKLKEEAKVRDLVLFCSSEDWSTLREALGLSVAVK
jgi:tetratricopeptide (TPR) repeat protein